VTQPIPLVDLRAQHAEIARDLAPDLERILDAAAFVGGPDVAAFEEDYASFVRVRHCVGVGNGTDAVELALRALHIGIGDEVVLPANTFIATAEGVVRAGAVPVLVDVDPETLLIDPQRVAEALTGRTRAVLAVHLYGQMAPVEKLERAVEGTGVVVVEDAAQSQGASRHGVLSGAAGVLAATSFYPGKNLGAAGDAGAVTTDDDDLAEAVRMLGNHGSREKYVHEVVGFNSRLDTSRRQSFARSCGACLVGTGCASERLSDTWTCSESSRRSACPSPPPGTSTCGTSSSSASPTATECWLH